MENNSEAYGWTPAGFWIRALALTIDSILISLITLPLSRGTPSYQEEHPFAFFFISLAIWGTWGALGNAFFQGSLGKRICSLKLVDQDNGQAVGFGIVFFRDSIGRLISTLPVFLGYVWAAFSKEKKTLHDHIFATRVVKRIPLAVFNGTPTEEEEHPESH